MLTNRLSRTESIATSTFLLTAMTTNRIPVHGELSRPVPAARFKPNPTGMRSNTCNGRPGKRNATSDMRQSIQQKTGNRSFALPAPKYRECGPGTIARWPAPRAGRLEQNGTLWNTKKEFLSTVTRASSLTRCNRMQHSKRIRMGGMPGRPGRCRPGLPQIRTCPIQASGSSG